jgi:hypothetical protein
LRWSRACGGNVVTMFLYPLDQSVAHATRGMRRTSRPAIAVVIVEFIVLVAVVVTAAATTLFGISFLVLTNPVLGDTMPEGSLMITQSVDATTIVAGDVVTIASSDAGEYITGRVTEVHRGNADTAKLTLAASENAEITSVHVVDAAQRVVVVMPGAGYFLAAAAQPAIIGFLLLVALGLVLQLVPRHRRALGGHRGHARTGARPAVEGPAPHRA